MVRDGRQSTTRALDIVAQVTMALQHIHERGIIHRDIKAENILVNTSGQVRLIDFGMAMVFEDCMLFDASFYRTHRLQTQCGTPLYAAPEVLEPNKLGYEGPPVDIWGLGCVLYLLLTARLPFVDGDFNGLRRRVRRGLGLEHFVVELFGRETDRSSRGVIEGNLRSLISALLTIDVRERATTAKIFQLCAQAREEETMNGKEMECVKKDHDSKEKKGDHAICGGWRTLFEEMQNEQAVDDHDHILPTTKKSVWSLGRLLTHPPFSPIDRIDLRSKSYREMNSSRVISFF